jgi:hypothetical protein
MQNMTILTITRRSEWLTRMRPVLHARGRRRLIVADSMNEAGRLLEVARPQLIVVHDDEAFSYEALDLLLWSNSVLARPAPVMVVADGYSTERAITLFQMGVDEYVCVIEHGDRMSSILSTLTARGPAAVRYPRGGTSTAAQRPEFRLPTAVSMA